MVAYQKVGDLISKSPIEKCGNRDYPVLSMTMRDGIVFQNDRFKKQIASVDQSTYNVVRKNQLVVSFPIDEGVLAVQDITDAGIVSPAYKIWNIDESQVVPKYLELFLRSPHSIQYYKSKLRGTTARRRSITDADLLDMEVPKKTLEEQSRIIECLSKSQNVIRLYQQQLEKFDELIKARFVEMFGDPMTNPLNWKKDNAEHHIDLLSGYPFKSEQYVDSGVNICGGLIIMPQRIEWDSCVHLATTKGYEEYLLAKGDIVMALDRPWITEGFKIALVDGEHLPALLIQRTARIRATDINQKYLYHCFINGGFDKHTNITGSLVPHISAKDIKSFEIMLPQIDLQTQFAAFVEQNDKSKVAVQKALDEAQLLFDSLMQEYFG